MNTTNLNYGWLSRKLRSHTLSRGRVGGINPVPSRNGTAAPCLGRPRALNANFVVKQRPVARGQRSTEIFIWTIIYRCEALDVSFPMDLEPSCLNLYSSSYDQISDRRSGLTALGEFLRTDLRMRIHHRIS
ncbi:hypothetical protein PIB30_043049 [Stylosanthes scabra]|uniref:Uncharacterized protein n=1 Tax=Stylosanthes scabra TaxID=79078 RepID=A0ABU6ZE64_9FABA|nr:hypothetical protein [Stylosanthes scabra]